MLFRFSLYGFLKNQKYFEPVFFLVLLQEKGLSFTMLGILIGFEGICINLFEVPSGAIADLYGRRKCMILSFICYIMSFIIFALANALWMLFGAIFFFSIGEAFRTGTHKAMIFDWLRLENRIDERTRFYGFTRSWSQIGSAVSSLIGMTFMLSWRSYYSDASYSHVFLLCIIPYFIGILNFLSYPIELDGTISKVSLIGIVKHLWYTLKDAVKNPKLRRLFLESMSFDGVFKTVKDYVQPITNQMVLGLSVFIIFRDKDQQATLAVYSIYFILSVLAVFASRNAYKVDRMAGGDDKGCRFIWWMTLVLFIIMMPFLYFEWYIGVIIAFIIFHVIQNLWRPLLISRFDAHSRPETAATILSLESQAKFLFTAIAAPFLGFFIDFLNSENQNKNFWPISVFGIILTFLIILSDLHKNSRINQKES